MTASISGTGGSVILGFGDYRQPALRLAERANITYEEIEVHTFPDGESRVRLPSRLPGQAVVCQTLDHPNDKLVELVLAARTARRLGVGHLTLVVPYLCYMRQDKEFHPGESISQQIIGEMLASYFDALITVDPHLHRIHSLDQVFPDTKCVTMTATQPMSEFLATTTEDPLLIGPDEESLQWVESIAAHKAYDFGVAKKTRTGDYSVDVELPQLNYEGRDVVLVDDIASSGQTLVNAAEKLKSMKAGSVSVLVTHALFAGDALDQLEQAGVSNIWSTDSVLHDSNCIHLDSLLADALAQVSK
ncbi:MAG: ribose-phosphate diphosphokinase [Acidiferrobacterales bacterium]